jgi:hypothetical protein
VEGMENLDSRRRLDPTMHLAAWESRCPPPVPKRGLGGRRRRGIAAHGKVQGSGEIASGPKSAHLDEKKHGTEVQSPPSFPAHAGKDGSSG